jgi:hypothetical protein
MLSWLHFYRRSGLGRGKGESCQVGVPRGCGVRAESRNTRGVQLSQKYSPTRLPTNYPTTGTSNCGAPYWLDQGHLNWEWPN